MMEKQQKKDKLKIVIIVLAILLLISSVALAGTLVYKHFASTESSSVVVPDNIITPDADINEENQTDSEEITTENNQNDSSATEEKSSGAASQESSGNTQSQSSSTNANANTNNNTITNANINTNVNINTNTNIHTNTNQNTDRKATAISLHNRNAGDHIAFNAGNMFPGDAESKYFCVQVSYQDAIAVKFHADIRSGYEKLAEVLNCKMVLLTTGKTMYDGLMRHMPSCLEHVLYSPKGTTDELYYEITTYLDTSVGNEYQNEDLIADLRWWVEEEEHLSVSPQTGDPSNLTLWLGFMCASLSMLRLLFVARKKEGQNEQQ